MSLKIILRNDKINKEGEGPLFLRYTRNRKSTLKSLDIFVKPEQWDNEAEMVNGSYDADKINSYLQQKKVEAAELISSSKDIIDNPKLKISRLYKYRNGLDFIKYANESLDKLKASGNVLTYKNYRSSVKKFVDFMSEESVPMQAIDRSVLNQYVQFLDEQLGNSKNTIYNNLKVIKKIFNVAVKEGLLNYEMNPFVGFKLEKQSKEKEFLSENELYQIERLNLANNSAALHVKKIYLFSCYTGLNISVIQGFKWSDFDGGKLQWGDKWINIINKAIQVINSYQLNFNKFEDDHIFPQFSLTYINKLLKEIAKSAGVEKNLKYSSGRNTFIILAMKKGIRIDQLARLLRIRNLMTLNEYTRYINNDLDLVVGKLNKEFL
ncbi:MAG: site-specific integrase [Bacteroidetes bacterium]|nr:site-specific integrase [Bacteroidota bacterium]